MAKQHRGSTIRFMTGRPGRGRGICPICSRTGVKLLWTAPAGTEGFVCKQCQTRSK